MNYRKMRSSTYEYTIIYMHIPLEVQECTQRHFPFTHFPPNLHGLLLEHGLPTGDAKQMNGTPITMAASRISVMKRSCVMENKSNTNIRNVNCYIPARS